LDKNNYTVTVADAHDHSIAQGGIPAGGPLDAVLHAATAWQSDYAQFSAFVLTDTWTITVTQP